LSALNRACAGLAIGQSGRGPCVHTGLAVLCALPSALAGVPIRQSLAVTGSINQFGRVQAIGAVKVTRP
jgi:ATP-dependent Lon protease